jgi:hypothetical protein
MSSESGPVKLSLPPSQTIKSEYYGIPQPTEEDVYLSNSPDDRTRLQKVINDFTFGLAYIRKKPTAPLDSIPVGMSLFLRQKGYHDLGHTIGWRVFWFLFCSIFFGVQFILFEKAILWYRMHTWCLIFSMVYFLVGIFHVSCKSLDRSKTTRALQASYVLATSFTMAASIFYIFILFMDDINRRNPRKDNVYVVMADGFIVNTYLRTGRLTDPETIIETILERNEYGLIFNPSRYQFVWVLHIMCHILLPIILMVPLYIENTRIYYTDFIYTLSWTILYTAWLWIGSQVTYNRRAYTPCVGSVVPYCPSDKINPEYRTIYTKLNFYQRGETASYILLLYFFVFVSFYLCRAISKRYARSAVLSYKQPIREAPLTANMQNFNAIPDENSIKYTEEDAPIGKDRILKTPVNGGTRNSYQTETN